MALEMYAARASDGDTIRWHSANHIHGWFVRNVQGGQDTCKEYEVSPEKLRQLLDACDEVLENSVLVDGMHECGTEYDESRPSIAMRTSGKAIENSYTAKSLLPRMYGYGFGSQTYDEDYLDEVKRTREWVAETLEQHENADSACGWVSYQSSW